MNNEIPDYTKLINKMKQLEVKINLLNNELEYRKKIQKFNKSNCFLTKEKVIELGKSDSYYNEAVWNFFYQPVINELEKFGDIGPVLEMGPYKAPFVKNCDVIDRADFSEFFTFNNPNVIIHDCSKTPFPIEDKKYDLVIASQVLEHLGYEGEQVKIFKEISRICNRAIISLPYKWIRPLQRNHHMIDENVFDAWQDEFEPIYEKTNDRIILRVYNFSE